MKEAFWGVLIVVLGLFGIVVINVFQNVTVDNDRVYYLIKESTEAAAYDSIDLAHFRVNGSIRIVEDKFVENLTRRFAENTSLGNYRIVIEDINENPPKISLKVETGVGMLNTSILRGETFNIVNRVDAIIETKYSLEEVLEFLDITKEEYEEEVDTTADVCKITNDESSCIDGDIKFIGADDANLTSKICYGDTPKYNVEKKFKYKVCECGKWQEEKTQVITANPVQSGNEYVYTWNFTASTDTKTITETLKERVLIEVCTTEIGIMVPKDIEKKNQDNVDKLPYNPGSDNTNYVACPEGGIRIAVGMSFVVHPNYIPPKSVNRDLVWTSNNSDILGINGTNPSKYCELNSNGTNCLSTAVVTAKKVGTAYINVKTTRNQTATCKIEVFDGNVDSVDCEDLEIAYNGSGVMKRSYTPSYATKIDFKWSISDSNIATINQTTGEVTAKSSGTATVTITAPNGKTGTCNLKVKAKPADSGGSSDGNSSGGGCECSCPYTYIDSNGKKQTKTYCGNKKYEYKDSKLCKSYCKTSKNTCNEQTYGTCKTNATTTPAKTTKDYCSLNSHHPLCSTKATTSAKKTSAPTTKRKPSGCFLEGTKVLTNNGYKDIDKINVSDYVLSYNELTKENEYKRVSYVYIHKKMSDVLYTFTLNGKKVEASSQHRFYVISAFGNEWINAEDIKVGYTLMDKDGNVYRVEKISRKNIIADLYNLEVEDNHTYYVSESNILVHNAKVKF